MLERYTIASRQAVFFARFEAGRAASSEIDTEHLLLGVSRVDRELMQQIAPLCTQEYIQNKVATWNTRTEAIPTSTDMQISEGLQHVFERVEALADAGNCPFIRTEHLLLSLLDTVDSHAHLILLQAGADLQLLRSFVETVPCHEQQEGLTDGNWMTFPQ